MISISPEVKCGVLRFRGMGYLRQAGMLVLRAYYGSNNGDYMTMVIDVKRTPPRILATEVAATQRVDRYATAEVRG
jgi:hypothetical protein